MTDLSKLKRRARRGRRQFLYWYDRDGAFRHAAYSKAAIKEAILSVGARGRFYWLDGSGVSSVARTWRMMVHLWRCAPSARS